MPQYRYKARDKEGGLHTGTMEARGKEAVADQLSGQGYIPVQIEELEPPSQRSDLLAWFSRVKSQDLIIFSRQLSTLMGAGIPFIQSITTIERQTENRRLKKTLMEIRQDVVAGASFSEALAKYPAVFNKLYVTMIRAGETAGILNDILDRLALLAEHEAETRARVKAAVRYPLIVVVTICAAFIFLITFVIPRFAEVFAQFKTELPLPTRMLIGINYMVQHYWYMIVLALGLLVWGARWYLGTQQGRWQWDRFKLKLPVFGMLFQKVALSRFARMFGALQKSGISMMLTLEIAAETVGNVVLAHAVEEMRDSLREGKGLSGPMEASGLFPPLVVQMMAVGEESGDIDTMLTKVSDYYDLDVEYMLRNLSTMIEPILLLVIGGMVLFLALAVFLPMWNVMNLYRK